MDMGTGNSSSLVVQCWRLSLLSSASTVVSFSEALWMLLMVLVLCCLLQSSIAFPCLPFPKCFNKRAHRKAREKMRDEFQTTRNELTNGSVCNHHLKSRAPAHGEYHVWHMFNQSNQWGPHFEYYLHATDSLGGNYAAIFNGGNDSASNRKKYSSKHHQLLMDNSQMRLRVKTLSLKKLFSYGKTAICGSLRF